MQALQSLVRNLAIILLLATFMEMLLPNRTMRGYVQLIMGLFVISAILNPLTAFLKHPLELEIPAWTVASPQDMPVLASDGVRLGKDAVEEQYRRILAHQIEGLALGVGGVQKAEAEISFEGKNGDLTEQPRISTVEITISADKDAVEPIKPVIIGESDGDTSKDDVIVRDVREKVSKLMEIPEEKIRVHF